MAPSVGHSPLSRASVQMDVQSPASSQARVVDSIVVMRVPLGVSTADFGCGAARRRNPWREIRFAVYIHGAGEKTISRRLNARIPRIRKSSDCAVTIT